MIMTATSTTYSIAEARNQFAALIRQVEEAQAPVKITRRGEPVAVILSQQEYEALAARPPQRDFWQAYLEYRERWQDVTMDIEGDIWDGVRDTTPPREANPWL
jgi:prevent-host-death family protein